MTSLPQNHKQIRPEERRPYKCVSSHGARAPLLSMGASPISVEPWPEQCQPGHELLSTFGSHVLFTCGQ